MEIILSIQLYKKEWHAQNYDIFLINRVIYKDRPKTFFTINKDKTKKLSITNFYNITIGIH